MDTRTYENQVLRTMGNGDDLTWALGIGGESGEILDLIKKLHYHGGMDKKGPITRERILNETGDVLWYITALLKHFGYNLEDCMVSNIEKLKKRHPDGFTFKTAQAHLDEQETPE